MITPFAIDLHTGKVLEPLKPPWITLGTEPVLPGKGDVWSDHDGNTRMWNGTEWVDISQVGAVPGPSP